MSPCLMEMDITLYHLCATAGTAGVLVWHFYASDLNALPMCMIGCLKHCIHPYLDTCMTHNALWIQTKQLLENRAAFYVH